MSADGRVIGAAPLAEEFFIRTRIRVTRPPVRVQARIDLYVKTVLVFQSALPEAVNFEERGVYDIAVKIPPHLLAETQYSVDVFLQLEAAKTQEIKIPDAVSFMTYGSSYVTLAKTGVMMPKLEWSTTTAVPEAVEVRG